MGYYAMATLPLAMQEKGKNGLFGTSADIQIFPFFPFLPDGLSQMNNVNKL